MTATEVLFYVATAAGLLMATSPVLQIRRMRRTRSSNDVSLLYLGMLNLGFVAWLAYGWSVTNWALLISNTASFLVMTATILIALLYRRGGSRRAAAALAAEAAARPSSRPADAPDQAGLA